jgi:hypothetical protein
MLKQSEQTPHTTNFGPTLFAKRRRAWHEPIFLVVDTNSLISRVASSDVMYSNGENPGFMSRESYWFPCGKRVSRLAEGPTSHVSNRME